MQEQFKASWRNCKSLNYDPNTLMNIIILTLTKMAWRHPKENSSFSSFSSEPFHHIEDDRFSAFEE